MTLWAVTQPLLHWPVTSLSLNCYIFPSPLITIRFPIAFSEIYHCYANQRYFKPHHGNSPGCAAVEVKVVSASSLSISCPCSLCGWERGIPPRGSVGGKPKKSREMDELTAYSEILPLAYQVRPWDTCFVISRCTELKKSSSTTKFFKSGDALCERKKEISITSIKSLPRGDREHWSKLENTRSDSQWQVTEPASAGLEFQLNKAPINSSHEVLSLSTPNHGCPSWSNLYTVQELPPHNSLLHFIKSNFKLL